MFYKKIEFMKKLFNISILVILFLPSFLISSSYDEGIEFFLKSNLKEAQKKFLESYKKNEKKDQSTVFLFLINNIYSSYNTNLIEEFNESFEDPNPYISSLLFDIYPYVSHYTVGDDYYEQLEDLIEDKALDSDIKAHLYDMMVRYHSQRNEFKDASKIAKNINSFYDWNIIGEFENISGSGFDVAYPPETEYDLNKSYQNKYGMDIKWRKALGSEPGRWLYLNNYFYTEDVITYAQTFVKSPKKQKVNFRLGVSGSVKVFVNDQVVYKNSDHNNNGLDSYCFNVDLDEGYNKVLIKLGTSGDDNSINFILRVTDLKDSNLVFEHTTDIQTYNKKSGENIVITEHESLKKLKKLFNENPSEVLYPILLTKYYTTTELLDSAKYYLDILEGYDKFNSLFISELKIDYFLRAEKITKLKLERESVKKNHPKSKLAFRSEFNEAKNNENVTKADSLLGIIKDYKEYFSKSEIIQFKLELEVLKKSENNILDLISEGYKENPHNSLFVFYKYILYKNGYKNNSLAEDVLTSYLEEHNDFGLRRVLESFYSDINDYSSLIDYYEDLHEDLPYEPYFINELFSANIATKKYNDALIYADKLIELEPSVSRSYAKKAMVFKEMSKKNEAISFFEKALKANPLDYESREQIRILKNEKNSLDLVEEPDLEKKLADYVMPDSLKNETVILVYEETRTVVYDGGGYEQKNYNLYKTLNKDGVDYLKEFALPISGNQSYNIEKANVLKKNGNKLKAEIEDYYIVFTNLEEGDAIEIVYTTKTYNGFMLYDKFWDGYYFKSFIPIGESVYNLFMENDKPIQYVVTNNENLKPIISDIDGFKHYNWKVTNSSPIKYEENMPPLNDVGEILRLSNIDSWEYINNWYQKLMYDKVKSDYEIKNILKEIIDEKDTDLEKARKIYKYIVENIRYSSIDFRQSGLIPQKATKCLGENLGDCKDVSTLFVTMCNEINLDANVALVSTRDVGQNSMPLPSIEFNHCIAEIRLDGKNYFVELTSDNLPFSTFHSNLKNSFTLPIRSNSKNPIILKDENYVKNKILRNSQVEIKDSELSIKRESQRFGNSAASSRNSYKFLKEDEVYDKMKNAVTDDNQIVKLHKVEFDSTLNSISDFINYKVNHSIMNAFTEVKDMLIFEIPWADKFTSSRVISYDNRNHPLMFDYIVGTDNEVEEMEILIPGNKKLEETPKNIKISNAIFDYQLTYTLSGNTLKCRRELKLKKNVVDKNEYQTFKSDIETIIKNETNKLVLVGSNNAPAGR